MQGCGLWQPSALSKCQAEKKQVLNRLLAQQRELDDLQSQRQLLTQRVAEAERQLAQVYDQAPGRLAEGRRSGGSSASSSDSSGTSSNSEKRGQGAATRFQRDGAVPNEWTPRQRRE
jgi:chromosome segregation ATPase